MKHLKIDRRYVGSEVKEKMNDYNMTLKEILEDKLILLERISLDGQVVSASHVRELLKEGSIEKALTYIPRECHSIFKMIAYGKYGK